MSSLLAGRRRRAWTGLASVAAFACSVAALGVACSKDDKLPPPGVAHTTSSTTTSGSGAAGGGGSTGSGGAATGGGGSGGEALPPVADQACAGDFAFRAAGMTFAAPTPQVLASVFGELAYDPAGDHPITIVLQSVNTTDATLAAAPSVDDGSGIEVFAQGLAPSPTSASLKQGSFATVTPQAHGHLRLRHETGVLDLALDNLAVFASTSGGCSQAVVTLEALIPASERQQALTLTTGPTTVGALAGGNAGDAIQFRALFVAESISFDFSTL